jgi:hypothetical protein
MSYHLGTTWRVHGGVICTHKTVRTAFHFIKQGERASHVLMNFASITSEEMWYKKNGRGLHCKDKMPKSWYKYSQKRNIGASVLISTFMCLWENYIFPRWVCLFCWRKYVDWSWEYVNRSKTYECGNWGWGRAIPRKGIVRIIPGIFSPNREDF